ncbi:MAG: phosphotransferase [Caldilineaceae bacterium]
MQTDPLSKLHNLSADELKAILVQLLGAEAFPVEGWTVTEIGRSAGTSTAGIFRLAGAATTADGVLPWSTVVKVLGPPRLEGREYDPMGALRELAFYRASASAIQRDRVRSPRCYAIEEWDNLHFIWLEDLSAAPQPPWLPKHFIQAAQHVGQFNWRWAEPALPDWPWLNPNGLREKYRAPNHARAFAQLSALAQVPIAGRTLPTDIVQGLLQLWQSGDKLFAKVEEGRKCLCHRDYHPKNLFPMPDTGAGSYTVAIDWDQAGVEYLGADIGLLLGSPIKWMELSPDQAEALIEPIFDAYLAGLAEAGWSGNEDAVRLTYLTCLSTGEASRLAWLTSMVIEYPERHASFEQLLQHPIAQIFDWWVEALRFFLTHHDRALQLARRQRLA